jgi:integrase
MMEFVFKPKRRVNGKVRSSRTYVGQYRLAGDLKPMRVPLGVSDKQVAEEKLRRIVREEEMEREGLIAPREQREVAKSPLTQLIEEFASRLRGLGRDEKYVRELKRKLLLLAKECAWQLVRDITAKSFEEWRGKQPLTAKTRNEYHNALSAFCNWIEPRVGRNAIRGLLRVDQSGERTFIRRSLEAGQFYTLVEVSEERGAVYLTAGYTGLRRGELNQLLWRDVNLDTDRPHITVRSSISKNHQAAMLPLAKAAAAMLRLIRPIGFDPKGKVFPRIPSMKQYRIDLGKAGIPYEDDSGGRMDFHALRTTFSTLQMRAGVSEFVRMKLMRVNEFKLTQKTYLDASMIPYWEAIVALEKTNDTQIDALKSVASGQDVSASVPTKGNDFVLLAAGDQIFSPSESASVRESLKESDGARCRVRTCDFLRVKQALYH